jgi:hypothetical protein
MINHALERQAKSTDEPLHRLIEEWDGKKHDDPNAKPSTTSTVNFAQINSHTSGPLVGGTSMPNPSAQPMNHFHIQTTIDGLVPNLGMSQQATTSMYGQGYTQITPSFTMPNPTSTPYTSGFNGRAYPNPSGNFQAPYTTTAYTDPIPLPGSSLGFLPNHAYQTLPCFNASANDVLKLRMFSLSLSGTAFTWFTSLAPNSIFTWVQLEAKFHEYFYSGDTKL